jgi:hypothetical protein
VVATRTIYPGEEIFVDYGKKQTLHVAFLCLIAALKPKGKWYWLGSTKPCKVSTRELWAARQGDQFDVD